MSRSLKFRERRAALWGVALSALDSPKPIAEVLEYNDSNQIRLFEYQGRWSYCLRVWPGDIAGVCYGPFLSFCDPYPDRMAALIGAVSEILHCCNQSKRKTTKALTEWAKALITPKQLRLI